jgi:hypothetical protein
VLTVPREPALSYSGAEMLDELRQMEDVTPQSVRSLLGSPHELSYWTSPEALAVGDEYDETVEKYHCSDGTLARILVKDDTVHWVQICGEGGRTLASLTFVGSGDSADSTATQTNNHAIPLPESPDATKR